jgi:hypothetical protein
VQMDRQFAGTSCPVLGTTGRGGGRWARGGAVEQAPAFPQVDDKGAEWLTVEGISRAPRRRPGRATSAAASKT